MEFSVLPKDTLICRQQRRPGIEPATLRLVEDTLLHCNLMFCWETLGHGSHLTCTTHKDQDQLYSLLAHLSQSGTIPSAPITDWTWLWPIKAGKHDLPEGYCGVWHRPVGDESFESCGLRCGAYVDQTDTSTLGCLIGFGSGEFRDQVELFFFNGHWGVCECEFKEDRSPATLLVYRTTLLLDQRVSDLWP